MPKVILGGGLSGLSAAYYLTKLSRGETVSLLEASGRLGGWIKSEKVTKGAIFEQAPRTIRPGGPAGINTLNLLDDLGLNVEVVPIPRSHVAAKKRLIYANGELHTLPNSLLSLFVTQKPFSKPILSHILHDLRAAPKYVSDDTVYEFTKRRFGPEVADYLIDTIICGICAGNSKEISVNFIMKKLFVYEQTHGGIIKGVLKSLLGKKEPLPLAGALAARSKKEKWSVYTFKNGMETLPVGLESALRNSGNIDIHLNSSCKEITFHGSKDATVTLKNGKKLETSHIVSSLAAYNLGLLVKNQHPELAAMLTKTKMVTVGVINLLYNKDLIKNPAFGFLVPPKEKLPILGVIYDSCCRNCKDMTVLTVMMGGYWFKDLFGDNPSESTLLKVATDHLQMILGITEKPLHYKVNILKDCIPQYVVGHQKNVDDINKYVSDKKLPLSLCGSSYHGVGVNDVILSAKNAVENIVSQS